MERVLKDKILEFRADTLEAVRKDVNLDARSVEEAVDLLQDWLKKQTHFVKKDFSRQYLEFTLITCKGSVERSKQRLDKLCTFKTLMPEFFITTKAKELDSIKQYIDAAVLPKLTKEHCRIGLLKYKSDNFDSHELFKYHKYVVLNAEYLKRNDYFAGFVVMLDCSFINPLNIASALNPMELRKMLNLLTEGYGMRLKGIHLLTSSKLIDALIMLIKQILSPKLASRIFVHKTLDTLYEYLPKEILPVEYGGEEKSLKQLHEDWSELLDSEDNVKYFNEMQTAATIESCRKTDNFNEHYIGMPGSFRKLTVD